MDAEFLGLASLEIAQRLVAETELALTVNEFLASLVDEMERLYPTVEPMAGARELTAHFAFQGIPQAIATSSSRSALLQKFARHGGWIDEFQAVVCSDDVQRGKPAPDLFLGAASQLGVEPAACLVFEDAPAGVEAALSAGMNVVAVPEQVGDDGFGGSHQVIDSLLDFDPEDWGLPPRLTD